MVIAIDGPAASGKGNTDNSAIDRLFRGIARARQATIAFELAGAEAAAWTDEEEAETGAQGMDFLMRQVSCIGGGTTEISRNVIAERVLGMPREASGDKGVPFRDVPRGPSRGCTGGRAPGPSAVSRRRPRRRSPEPTARSPGSASGSTSTRTRPHPRRTGC